MSATQIRRHDSRVASTSARSRFSVALAITSRHWRSNSAASSGISAARSCAGEASANGGRQALAGGSPAAAVTLTP